MKLDKLKLYDREDVVRIIEKHNTLVDIVELLIEDRYGKPPLKTKVKEKLDRMWK